MKQILPWSLSLIITYLILSRAYRGGNKGLFVLLSRTQAWPGRTVKQEQEENSCNHVQTFISPSVYILYFCAKWQCHLRELWYRSCYDLTPGQPVCHHTQLLFLHILAGKKKPIFEEKMNTLSNNEKLRTNICDSERVDVFKRVLNLPFKVAFIYGTSSVVWTRWHWTHRR